MSLILYADGMSPDLSRHFFYNGEEELAFDQQAWTWYRILKPKRDRQKLDGVTNIVHIIDKSEALMPWAVKKALEKFCRLLLKLGDTTLTEPMLIDLMKEAKKADREELEDAGEVGHLAHEWIEKYIKAILSDNEPRRLELLSKFPDDPRASRACTAAIEWMYLHNVRWLSTERRCYSRIHGYAGTMDGLARVDSCSDPDCCPASFKDRLTLVDWKTSNYLYVEYLYQTAAYQQAYQEETGEEIEDRWIIRLGKEDGEFDPWHAEGREIFEADLAGFLDCLALTRIVKTTKDRVADVKEARRARAKAALVIERQKKCLDADKYKGSRKKKGCNDTNVICEACNQKYVDKHPANVSS